MECSLLFLLHHLMFRQWFVSCSSVSVSSQLEHATKDETYWWNGVTFAAMSSCNVPWEFFHAKPGGKVQYHCLLRTQSIAVLDAVWMNTHLQETPHFETKWFKTDAGDHKEMAKWQSAPQTEDVGQSATSGLSGCLRVNWQKSTAVETLCGCS